MIRINKSENVPSSLLVEKEKANGTYNTPEVLRQLKIDFHNKCYICESKGLHSINIEHFVSHRGDKELKFDWNNLFLSCTHCNNIKSDNYDNILDCTKIDVDEVISFRKKGTFSWQEEIEIIGLNDEEKTQNTVELLNKVYNGTTYMKTLETYAIKKSLNVELTKFVCAVNEFYEAEGEDKEDAKSLVKSLLKASSPFAAFKRWIVKDNQRYLSEIL